MTYLYSSYLSPIDSLVFDSITDPAAFDKEAADELALWTNAQFSFDIQSNEGLLEDLKSKAADMPSVDNYPYSYEASQLPGSQEQQQQAPQPPIALNTISNYPAILPMPQRQRLLPKPVSGSTLTGQQSLDKGHPADKINSNSACNGTLEEQKEAQAAEDDKRRRNTAASARFRLKKKMREQQMEQTVREMTEKSEKLEERARELELEIKWLRGLLLEKGVNLPDDQTSS
ncbi:hypothetical protein EC973_007142 [Apophysomyces ossiformis]|uniref:BZIP domain-containing protein n=1 Tax=Apophysomyces ossiformis TaxID=679940 RepID=A0A8H7BZ39_9FUNG|nr:hypothetical protein EC973_007142 [Apophysomyces ossiformis]